MGRKQPLTLEQAQSRKDKAVRFTRDVVGDPDRADEIEDESLESYAERRKLKLENPTVPRHHSEGKTKAERMEYLREDARRILAAPEKHTAAEVRWARDMLAARNPAGDHGSAAGVIVALPEEISINDALEILQAAYRPNATRAELARAVGAALDALQGGDNDGQAA